MKTFRIKFQTVYDSFKSEMTYDINQNIDLLVQALEERLNNKISDVFLYEFKFFHIENTKEKITNKQMLEKFFNLYKFYYEETFTTETTRNDDEKVISDLIGHFSLKKVIKFKLRNYKGVFYIYNNDSIDKIKKINRPDLAINKKELYLYDKSRKLKNSKILKELIKEKLKEYIN